jgi:Zn-finger protein
MKLVLLFSILFSSMSFSYTTKIDFDGYKFKDIKKSKSMHMQAHKEKILKKLQSISQNRKEKHQHRKKKIFHILKKLKSKYDKRQFNIQIVETDNANILRLKLNPRKTFFKKKNKYIPLSIQYNLGSEENFQDFQYESVVENINDEYFVDLDIESLAAGNYSASLKIEANDARRKKTKKV